jgi:hypothetical protein
VHRFTTLVLTATLSCGLVGIAPLASAAPTCADPDHPIQGLNRLNAAVGVEVTTFELGVFPGTGCGVTSAVAIVSSSRHVYRVTLSERPTTGGLPVESWVGDLVLRPKTLRNSEAGSWTVRYEVDGAHPDATEDAYGQVVRQTRASFDAGPEPVRKDRITLSGRLERANWNTRRFSGISKDVHINRTAEGDELSEVAAPRTRDNGRFRISQPFPGPGTYQLYYPGGKVSASVYSRTDHVAAP